ncbi:hypothetical protein TCON_0482 [Astathelohania contejeani]|uniref:RING-type domain-containing protein n=1 Tax=Astathelohania contejeani TaxID=164912 RepID=A0ABQ7I1L8_9MICR|nr:hypothetical protein TCON_0482 [Thelohania contejeani]
MNKNNIFIGVFKLLGYYWYRLMNKHDILIVSDNKIISNPDVITYGGLPSVFESTMIEVDRKSEDYLNMYDIRIKGVHKIKGNIDFQTPKIVFFKISHQDMVSPLEIIREVLIVYNPKALVLVMDEQIPNGKRNFLRDNVWDLKECLSSFIIGIIDDTEYHKIKDVFSNTSIRMYVREYVDRTTIFATLIISSVFIFMSFFILDLILKIIVSKDPLITHNELRSLAVMDYKKLGDLGIFKSCLICMENFNPSDKCRILHCNHYFHRNCVDSWLKKNSSRCPYCRRMAKNVNNP